MGNEPSAVECITRHLLFLFGYKCDTMSCTDGPQQYAKTQSDWWQDCCYGRSSLSLFVARLAFLFLATSLVTCWASIKQVMPAIVSRANGSTATYIVPLCAEAQHFSWTSQSAFTTTKITASKPNGCPLSI